MDGLVRSIFGGLFFRRELLTADLVEAAEPEQDSNTEAAGVAAVPVLISAPVPALVPRPNPIYCKDDCPICSQRARSAGAIANNNDWLEEPEPLSADDDASLMKQ